MQTCTFLQPVAASRPRRSTAATKRPVTYWEEYVETDPWYRQEMLSDVPDTELWAALEDSDVEDSASDTDGEEAESSSEIDMEDIPTSEVETDETASESDCSA